MHRIWGALAVVLIGVSVAAAVGITVVADDDDDDEGSRSFKAKLSGYQEVPTLSMTGSGTLRVRLGSDGMTATYTLTYADLTGNALFAHIHIGARGTNGGVIVFLCGGGGQAACPGTGGSVSGTLAAANVIGPAGQGIAAGEWGEFVAAMRAGATYGNVHSPAFPGGEIRGQLS